MTTEEFWAKSRKAYKQRQKAKKAAFTSKEDYLNSDLYKEKLVRKQRAEKWQAIDKNLFMWNKPEIAIDLSYGDAMTDKVFCVFQLHCPAPPDFVYLGRFRADFVRNEVFMIFLCCFRSVRARQVRFCTCTEL
jgi:hypothetical protein